MDAAVGPRSTRASGKTSLLAVVATGTSRDILPYIALARALQRSGFGVRLVTHQSLQRFVQSFGLPFLPLKGDPASLMRSTAFRDAIAGGSALAVSALLLREDTKGRELNFSALHAATKDVDGILCGISLLTECMAVAQKYGIPLILCPLLPYSPSGELPLATVLPEPFKYQFLNRLSYDLSGVLLWGVAGPAFNRFRASIGVGPQSGYQLAGVPQVTAFPALLVPRPQDWGTHVHMSSTWRLRDDDAATPPPPAGSLLAELTASPSHETALRPIYVDFGAVPAPDAIAFLRAAAALARSAGVPVILSAGETDYAAARGSPRIADLDTLAFEVLGPAATTNAPRAPKSPTPRVLVISGDTPPLTWLLPRCSVAVHEGAYAPTTAAFEAGVSQVIFPVLGEHHFWAARAAALGVAPLVHHPLCSFPEHVVECVGVARQAPMQARADSIGASLRATGDGATLAVAHIRDVLSRPQHRHCGVTCAWASDASASACTVCSTPFSLANRKHHCRSCGRLTCARCVAMRCHLPGYPEDAPQLTCERCLDSRRAFFAMHSGQSVLPVAPAGDSTGDSVPFLTPVQSTSARVGGGLRGGTADGSGMPATAVPARMFASPPGSRPAAGSQQLRALDGTLSPLPL